nr:unnamed protein product [Digitaria exilis]
MSAPPPVQPPSLAVDDFYNDDGFDWEAAVREIDEACARSSVSAPAPSAPAHHSLPPRHPEPSVTAPLHRPPAAAPAGGGAARQSTLDRFVGSFTKRRQEEERPGPATASAPAAGVEPSGGDAGRPGGRAGEGCSRQADEKAVEDRFVESFTRRQREKETAAPPAATAGGRKRPAARARKGCTPRANVEVELDPCAVALDHEAVQTWIYPRKIIFAAPSRPLVAQQIEACHNTVGIPQLLAAHVPLRILALTATPGSKHAGIQNVINNLYISELIYRDEEDSLVKDYVNTRKIQLVTVPVGSDVNQVEDMLLDIIRPRLNRLRDARVIDHRDYAKGVYMLKFINVLVYRGSLNLMRKNELFWQVKEKMKLVSSQGLTPKIQELIKQIVEYFGLLPIHVLNTDCLDTDKNDSKDSRIIVFSHFRGSVKEIYCSLQNINDKIRPVEFIGQSSAGKWLKGQTQKTQQAILQKFRNGEYNVLVATSIGEEGLDIMEVDLVICFDANVSPLRMIQRMGRTGRKHEGQVDILLW